MKVKLTFATIALAWLTGMYSVAAQNTTFTYQGRVLNNGAAFNGQGLFKFALITGTNDASFVTYWSNDGTSDNGSEPTAAVSVGVANGLFTMILGDTTLSNMMAIDA